MNDFKIGDNVWCWDGYCSPERGVVTELNACNMADILRCHLTSSNYAPDRIWSSNRLYHYPKDAGRLEGDMLDQADFLEKQSKVIAAQDINAAA